MEYQSKDELEKYARIYADALKAYENYDRETDDYRQLVSDLKNAEQAYFDALTNFANDYAPEDVKNSYSKEVYDTPEVGAWEKYVFEGSPWEHEDFKESQFPWVDFADLDFLEDNGFGEGMAPEDIEKYFNHFGVKFERGSTNSQGETSYTIHGEPNSVHDVIVDYKNMVNPDYKLPWEREDVNGDGDTDVATADTNGNGEKDTAVVTADSEPEKKEAVKAAKKELGVDKKDKTSTGKTKGELEDKPKENDVVSDKKKKDMTCSDATQKNIMAALLDHRF